MCLTTSSTGYVESFAMELEATLHSETTRTTFSIVEDLVASKSNCAQSVTREAGCGQKDDEQ